VSIEAGHTIGNYRILQQIGTGGMGAVYLAEHPLIGKKVALKVIHKELSNNREVVSRFFNEARAVNQIGNDHIVEVHDFGQSPEGHYFFLMEYLEGKTLAQVLAAERALNVQRALYIGAQIADALGAAHTAGIIHRDLKPDNVMLIVRLGDPDFVKILDFGLAKMFMGGAQNLTAAGVVLGTPQYMSPEACESKRDIDHRTDIYATGVLMFQMLCGQLPFDGGSMGEVLVKQVTHAPPAPRALNPHIPPSVEQIILRCLAKAPDARFPTMVALREALLDPDRYLASSPPVVPAALTRSAPGARTLFVDDAAPAAPAAGGLGHAPTSALPAVGVGRSTGAALALKAPPPSMVHNPAADARTMFQQGNPSAPMPAAAPAGGDQRTAILDDLSISQSRRSTAMPGVQVPSAPVNQTMVIGTPPGYKDRAPRRTWLVVLLLLIGAGAAGGGIALAMMMNKSAPSDPEPEPEPEPEPVKAKVPPPADEPPPPPPPAAAPDAGAATVQAILVPVRIESEPDGAEVLVDGTSKGKTPISIELPPDGAEHELVLRHPDMKEKKKLIKITGAQTIRLELEKQSRERQDRPRDKPPKDDAKKPPPSDEEDDLAKPDWLKKRKKG
jgi:serine/threonine-protein kinase